MRIFAFLMAVLVLALSIMPCADVDMSGNDDTAQSVVKATQDHQEHPEDNCSPFCQCTCCAGFYVNHAPEVADFHPELPSTNRFPHLPAAVYDRSLPVWQPPQLG